MPSQWKSWRPPEDPGALRKAPAAGSFLEDLWFRSFIHNLGPLVTGSFMLPVISQKSLPSQCFGFPQQVAHVSLLALFSVDGLGTTTQDGIFYLKVPN